VSHWPGMQSLRQKQKLARWRPYNSLALAASHGLLHHLFGSSLAFKSLLFRTSAGAFRGSSRSPKAFISPALAWQPIGKWPGACYHKLKHGHDIPYSAPQH
jgi:hypothetical protein